jgi:hypothetical protein
MRIRVDREGNFGIWGPLTWANFLDWFICLQAVFILVVSARASLQSVSALNLTLPLIAAMCLSHAAWVYVNREKPLSISQIPFLFIPLLLWVGFRGHPDASEGLAASEWLCWLQLFLFFWVLSNNARLRIHTKLLCALAVGLSLWACFMPLWNRQLIGHTSNLIEANRFLDVVSLETSHLFASSNLWGAYVLLFIPAYCAAALVPRLELVLRILCALFVLFCTYVLASQNVIVALAFVLVMIAYLLSRFSDYTKRIRKRYLVALVGLEVFIIARALFHEAVNVAAIDFNRLEPIGVGNYLWGSGRGTWLPVLADSPYLCELYRSDAALICFQYGLIGLLIGLVPYLYVLRQGWLTYKSYPILSSRGRGRQQLVKYERFCILMALLAAVVAMPNIFYALSLYEPSYGLLLVLPLSLLVKLSFKRRVYLPDRVGFKRFYMLMAVLVAAYLLMACV